MPRKARRIDPIYVSPDGGETVYEQLPNGDRIWVEQSQQAKDEERAYEESEMVGAEAIALRGGSILHCKRHGTDIVPYGI